MKDDHAIVYDNIISREIGRALFKDISLSLWEEKSILGLLKANQFVSGDGDIISCLAYIPEKDLYYVHELSIEKGGTEINLKNVLGIKIDS